MKSIYSLAIVSALLVGCATTQQVGERKMLDKSNSKPSWVNSGEDTWEKKDELFFKVTVPQQYDLNMGTEMAKALAVKEVTEQIYMRVSTQLGMSMLGNASKNNNAGKYLKTAVAAEGEQVEVSGLISQETYWERYQENGYSGVAYSYDVYRKFKISKNEYNMAKERILNKALMLAQAANDKKAEVELQKLFDKNSPKEVVPVTKPNE